MQETQNNPIFLRPRFQIDLKEDQQIILEKFEKHLKKNECPVKGKIVDGHIVLDVLKDENHFWSPQLHLEIEAANNNCSLLKGLFGPKPQVWTLFMFVHFGLAVLFIGILISTYVQWTLKNDFTLSLIILITIPIIWFMLYFAGRMGKKTGHDQMQKLHDFMEHVLEAK
ncbi:GTP-binding protein [Bacteroidota bacterium]